MKQNKQKIFYKNNCHTLNITIDNLLGECGLPSKDVGIVRKKVEEFILAKEKKFKIKTKIQ